MLFLFLLIALALVLTAVAFLLKPLDRSIKLRNVVLIAAVVAGLVASLYMVVGNPLAFDRRLSQPATNIEDAIAQLEARVAAEPKDAKALMLLAQAYATTGRRSEMQSALTRAVAVNPNDADTYAEAAETWIASADDRRIPDGAVSWLEKAVALNASHQRARWFLGIAQRQRGKDREAIETWEALLPIVDRSAGEALLSEVNDARTAIGMPRLADTVLKPIAPESIRVRVDLPDSMRSKLPPEAIVFIAARVPGTNGMPAAAKRYAIADLPGTVFLSDADSPMPTAKLSQLKQAEISAKISLDGTATAASSDIPSNSVIAMPGGKDAVTLVFGEKSP